MLHNNRPLFEQVVLRAADALGIEAGIVEKDYFVTLFLKEIERRQPDIIFKGGTSLSKCYKIINRFSEDIDLNVLGDTRPGESKRKELKKNIVGAIDQLDFDLTNLKDIKSRRDFNRYKVDYPAAFNVAALKPQLMIETAVFFRAYPVRRMNAGCLIYDYLLENGFEDMIHEYDLEPFELNVQLAERTLIDKLFAIGDYYLNGTIEGHSRHIYDLYKILEIVTIDDQMCTLYKTVREERKEHKTCLSARDGIDMRRLLQEIKLKDVYRTDYETITRNLLFDPVRYDTAVEALDILANSILLDC